MRFALGLWILLALGSSAAAQEVTNLEQLLEKARAQAAAAGCGRYSAAPVEDLTADECLAGGYLCVRVQNASSVDFDTFDVRFPDHVESYGSLAAGQTSAYRKIGCAYRYSVVRALSGERVFLRRVIDYVGEPYLSPGIYTYKYRAQELPEPRVGDDFVVHGYLGDELEVEGNPR